MTNYYARGKYPSSKHGLAPQHIYPYSKDGRIANTTPPFNYANTTKTSKLIRQHRNDLANISEQTRSGNVLVFNCSNIDKINLGKVLGAGWYRKTFKGMILGVRVAVKFGNNEGSYMRRCSKHEKWHLINTTDNRNILNGRNGTKAYNEAFLISVSHIARNVCRDRLANMSKHEIHISQTYKHPVFIPLLGYCIRNHTDVSGRYDIGTTDVVSVWELGKKATGYEFDMWQLRIQHCLKLVHFLLYLENKSIRLGDIKPTHIMFSQGEYKLIDFQHFTNSEPENKINNAKVNMTKMRHCIFKRLLDISFPTNVLNTIQPLLDDVKLDKVKDKPGLTASQWLSILNQVSDFISE